MSRCLTLTVNKLGWIYLSLAIIFETISTSTLKLSNGFSVLIPSVITIIGYIACFFFLAQALKTIEISVAYAIWGAAGIALISLIGILFFHESISFLKILFICLIIIGTAGLKLLH